MITINYHSNCIFLVCRILPLTFQFYFFTINDALPFEDARVDVMAKLKSFWTSEYLRPYTDQLPFLASNSPELAKKITEKTPTSSSCLFIGGCHTQPIFTTVAPLYKSDPLPSEKVRSTRICIFWGAENARPENCLLYTSPSPRD